MYLKRIFLIGAFLFPSFSGAEQLELNLECKGIKTEIFAGSNLHKLSSEHFQIYNFTHSDNHDYFMLANTNLIISSEYGVIEPKIIRCDADAKKIECYTTISSAFDLPKNTQAPYSYTLKINRLTGQATERTKRIPNENKEVWNTDFEGTCEKQSQKF